LNGLVRVVAVVTAVTVAAAVVMPGAASAQSSRFDDVDEGA